MKLTKQEKIITDLILQGQSTKQIASQLYVTDKTVKAHLTNIYLKHRVSSRARLLAFYLSLPSDYSNIRIGKVIQVFENALKEAKLIMTSAYYELPRQTINEQNDNM